MAPSASTMQLYTRNISLNAPNKHWLMPTLRQISGLVTRQGVTLDLPEEKAAHLVPELSFSRVGARLKIHF